MGALTNEKCTACRRDSLLVADSEMQRGKALRIALVLSPRLKAIIRQFSPNGVE
jgi:hypothetical protein